MTKIAPTVTTTHDWIRLNFGNNRGVTVSYSGEKSTGAVPAHVFNLWHRVHRFDEAALATIGLKKEGATHGTVAQAFADSIDSIWPEWNVAPKLPAIGDDVTINFGARRGVETGKVEKVRGTSITARFPTQGLVKFAADMIM